MEKMAKRLDLRTWLSYHICVVIFLYLNGTYRKYLILWCVPTTHSEQFYLFDRWNHSLFSWYVFLVNFGFHFQNCHVFHQLHMNNTNITTCFPRLYLIIFRKNVISENTSFNHMNTCIGNINIATCFPRLFLIIFR